jgi:hypothetical protein
VHCVEEGELIVVAHGTHCCHGVGPSLLSRGGGTMTSNVITWIVAMTFFAALAMPIAAPSQTFTTLANFTESN